MKVVSHLTFGPGAVTMTLASRSATPSRQRMIEDMKIRNLSPHTIQAYVDRVAEFAKHFGKSPQLLVPKEVRAYLVFLVEERRVSWSYYGQGISAIRFLYRVTLDEDWVVKGVVSPKKEMKLPVILSRAEVKQFGEAIASLKTRDPHDGLRRRTASARRSWRCRETTKTSGVLCSPNQSVAIRKRRRQFLLRLQEFHQLLGGLGAPALALAFRERACFEVPVPCFCREAIDFIG